MLGDARLLLDRLRQPLDEALVAAHQFASCRPRAKRRSSAARSRAGSRAAARPGTRRVRASRMRWRCAQRRVALALGLAEQDRQGLQIRHGRAGSCGPRSVGCVSQSAHHRRAAGCRLASSGALSCMSCCSSAAIGSVQAHGGVELGVVARRVGAELDQVARLVVARVAAGAARAPPRGAPRGATLVITRETDFSMSMAG